MIHVLVQKKVASLMTQLPPKHKKVINSIHDWTNWQTEILLKYKISSKSIVLKLN